MNLIFLEKSLGSRLFLRKARDFFLGSIFFVPPGLKKRARLQGVRQNRQVDRLVTLVSKPRRALLRALGNRAVSGGFIRVDKRATVFPGAFDE